MDSIQAHKPLKCPIPECSYESRDYKNDDPETALNRLYAHLHLKHHKGELIRAIFILAGYERKRDSDIWRG